MSSYTRNLRQVQPLTGLDVEYFNSSDRRTRRQIIILTEKHRCRRIFFYFFFYHKLVKMQHRARAEAQNWRLEASRGSRFICRMCIACTRDTIIRRIRRQSVWWLSIEHVHHSIYLYIIMYTAQRRWLSIRIHVLLRRRRRRLCMAIYSGLFSRPSRRYRIWGVVRHCTITHPPRHLLCVV